MNPTRAGLDPRWVTELNIDRLVLPFLSIVPIREALLNPVKEFMNAALFRDSICTMSESEKWRGFIADF
jgi:hypothetical protein